MRGRSRKWWLVALLVLAGIFIGNLIGEALQPSIPVLGRYSSIGFAPQELNLLGFASLTLGFSLRLNLVGALGAIFILFGQQRFL